MEHPSYVLVGSCWAVENHLKYPIQMISIFVPHKTNNLNSWFNSFIWAKKMTHLKMATLHLLQRVVYHLSAHLCLLSDKVHKESTSCPNSIN